MTLTAGVIYVFQHRRKGTFAAEFLGEVPGDAEDTVLWHVKIKTGAGSGHERLANTFTRDATGKKVPPEWSEKHLRPSLIEEVHAHGGH
jgi:hypothetical protein